MNIEDITAPPPRLSPQMRYASLHRTIEGGLATDRTWVELIEVCLELDLRDEAQSSFWQIKDASTRRRLLAGLQRRGLLLDVSLGAAESGDPSGRATRLRSAATDGDTQFERILDGFRFLFVDHMPLTAVVATVTFPIVVGLGGFLTAGVPGSMLLPLLALVPALSVVGLVGALGRRILVEASRGLEDPPEIPSLRELVPEAGRFLLDASLLVAVFLGPAALLAQFEQVGASAVLAAFAVGLTLFPMAMALRQTRDDWTCLVPGELFRAIVKGGTYYMALVGTGAALFAPSFVSVWMTSGSHLYLVLSVVGPLAVTPTFVMSRLIGTFLFAKRRAIPIHRAAAVAAPATARSATPRVAASPRATPRPASSRPNPGGMRAPAHPEARPASAARRPAASAPTPRPASTPAARKIGAPAPARSATPTRRAAPLEPSPAPTSIGTSFGGSSPRLRIRDEMSTTPGRAAATPTPAPAPARRRAIGDAAPDLTQMPGVSVLKGDARVAAGAAAPTRPTI